MDVEASPIACCRICLASGGGRGDGLISPCMCKGTQQFVHRTCLDHWRAVREGTAFSHCTTCKAQFHLRVEFLDDDMCRRMKFNLLVARDVLFVFLAVQACIAAIAGVAYLLDRNYGTFRNVFADNGHQTVSKHLRLFIYYCVGVLVFFALVGVCGLLSHCLSSDDVEPPTPCLAGGSCECFPASPEACLVFTIIVVVVFAIPGIIYGFIGATKAFQKIVQSHYHILTKKELTKVYIVEDLHGGYATPPKMDPEHEQRLKMLQLM